MFDWMDHDSCRTCVFKRARYITKTIIDIKCDHYSVLHRPDDYKPCKFFKRLPQFLIDSWKGVKDPLGRKGGWRK